MVGGHGSLSAFTWPGGFGIYPATNSPRMIAAPAMQSQRFELKYLADENTARQARDFVRTHLELDPHGAGKPDLAYPIHSLYLDSDQMGLYWDTINGNKNRFKLRLRWYRDGAEDPVFFEIKRRQNEAILKQRAMVRRAAVPELLAGRFPRAGDLPGDNPRQLAAVRNFIDLMARHDARPRARVSYRREAWISPHDNSVRVTMDRDVLCATEEGPHLSAAMHHPERVFGRQVVLEIKFTNRFPAWFGELVRVLGLRQGSAAKYVDGVVRLGEGRFHPLVTARREAQCRRTRELSRVD